ncbi:hypothetical protein ACFL37_00480 [Candidatus Margulisiibacteriota bacterium]
MRPGRVNYQKRARRRDFQWQTAAPVSRSAIGNKADNPAGCGIQTWKNPTKIVLAEINRRAITSEHLRLTFDPDSLTLSDTEAEIISLATGKFVSRTFRHAGYRSLIIDQPAIMGPETLRAFRSVLELAEQEKVVETIQALNCLSHSFRLDSLPAGEPVSHLIPGSYKHYTDLEGFEGIMDSGIVQGSLKNKSGKKRVKSMSDYFVSLSRLSLSPRDARDIFYTEQERQRRPDMGEYVISFNLETGSPEVEHLRSDRSLEGWVRGNLYLEDVGVIYAGENPLVDQAA